MKLSIHSLKKTLFSGEAEKIIARTTSGEITVLDDHIPLLSALVDFPVRVVDARGNEVSVPVSGGFLEVRPGGEVVILCD